MQGIIACLCTFQTEPFLYALMFALILLNLYFAVIPFFFYHFFFYEPTLFSKRFAYDCRLRRWINSKVLVVYLYPIADKYFLPFWEDNALIFLCFLDFFVFSLTSSNNFSSFTLLIISIGECFVVVCFLWL